MSNACLSGFSSVPRGLFAQRFYAGSAPDVAAVRGGQATLRGERQEPDQEEDAVEGGHAWRPNTLSRLTFVGKIFWMIAGKCVCKLH